mmetsp:Transcript_45507/g.126256  ORF Transcript_45507/g.126256 Transcript_45507/m.126256 type:complete len:474 (-) Transcript_45507:394-1815(-)
MRGIARDGNRAGRATAPWRARRGRPRSEGDALTKGRLLRVRGHRVRQLLLENLVRHEIKVLKDLLVLRLERPRGAHRHGRLHVVDHLAEEVELAEARRDRLPGRLFVLEVGLKGRVELHPHELLPVDQGVLDEEGVLLDLRHAAVAAAEPRLGVAVEEVESDRLGLSLEVGGELQVLVLREVLRLAPVLAAQRVLGGEHLDDEDAHVPPVGLLAVVALVHLGRAVAVRARDRHAAALVGVGLLGRLVGRCRLPVAARDRAVVRDAARCAHVRQLDEAVERQQHVVGLQVAVQHVQLMQVLRRQHDLRRVEDGALVGVRPAHQVRVHVASLNKVEHKAQMILRLEGVAQRHDERVLHAREHLLFSEDRVGLILRDEDPLVDHLDGVEPARVLLLGQQDHPKAAGAKEAVQVKLVDRHHLTLLEFQRRQLLVQVAVDKAREDVELHRQHASALDLVKDLRVDHVWLERLLDCLSV